MESAYYDATLPSSFGSVNTLAKHTSKNISTAADWLSSQDAYTLHKPVRRRFQRRKTIALGIDHLWQSDLIDVSNISRYNDGVCFILCCIDCFSRYAWTVPLKNKSSVTVLYAFDSILKSSLRRCTYLQTDKGREYLNGNFQSYLKRNNILFYTSENNDIKCALVERFNRTLKTRMYRYFTYTNSRRFVEVLPDLTRSYNASYHSSIRMAPVDVTKETEQVLQRLLYPKRYFQRTHRYSIGDKVRISETKKVFKKSYEGNWTVEIFRIKERINTNPHTYALEDLAGESIKGKFYEHELQKINKKDDGVFKIEKIMKTRKHCGKTQYLVRWLGYSPKFDSWVDDILKP